MDEMIYAAIGGVPTIGLLGIIAISLYALGKGADILVNEAIGLSIRWGIPKIIIGATIVSLGTTIPEVTVSVFAAMNGFPDLALGNALGSIITNTALILGLAALVGVLPMDKKALGNQGNIQLLVISLFTIISLPIISGGVISQKMGFAFLGLLILYIMGTLILSKKSNDEDSDHLHHEESPLLVQLIKLVGGVALVIISSKILIPSVEVTAVRIGIPQSIIAATLVAFGTSLPELVTSVTAVRKGHGALAIGNVTGANILNILFVIGGSAAVTKEGLLVPEIFFKLQIPTMMISIILFYLYSKNKDDIITKIQGFIFLAVYIVYLGLSYILI